MTDVWVSVILFRFCFQVQIHLPLDNPHVVDFGQAVRPNSEIFVGIRPELTIAHSNIRNFKLVFWTNLQNV